MQIIDELNKKQIEELHQLYQKEWWANERSIEETKACVEGSQICVGVVDSSGKLLGFARVLTDYIFKALIFDVIVSEDYRDTGISNKIMDAIKYHKKLEGVQHFELYCLPEMFHFYEKHGFSTDLVEMRLMRRESV